MQEKLVNGYSRFRNGYYKKNRKRLEQLAEQQTPSVAMVSCCDSRVEPSILFDVEPGDIFVIRNVANLVPPFETNGTYHGTSAALEFAVTGLSVKQIVVLGHANCGGIRALMEKEETIKPKGFVDGWMQIAAPAREEVLARTELDTLQKKTDVCEKSAIGYSLQNLMTYPWIRSRVESGKLDLVGCYYDLRSGELSNINTINASSLSTG
ncbi:Carbonic anhydrase, beta class [hydrothermal vent metagenome]|uniref:carbonic anhydrase n=1 Tax=hydrothermal vent metagenome TaxID=652676 RepID=A0A3B1A3Q8_9ZZZZ